MRRGEGSDYLKIMLNGVRTDIPRITNLDEPQTKALVEAAHANGMLAVAHVESLDDVNIALAAGRRRPHACLATLRSLRYEASTTPALDFWSEVTPVPGSQPPMGSACTGSWNSSAELD